MLATKPTLYKCSIFKITYSFQTIDFEFESENSNKKKQNSTRKINEV